MNDQVPDRYKGIFTNEEWVQHDFIVKGSWIYLAIAVVIHLFILVNRPWVR
jgi:light-harvesting complex 1 beta chain